VLDEFQHLRPIIEFPPQLDGGHKIRHETHQVVEIGRTETAGFVTVSGRDQSKRAGVIYRGVAPDRHPVAPDLLVDRAGNELGHPAVLHDIGAGNFGECRLYLIVAWLGDLKTVGNLNVETLGELGRLFFLDRQYALRLRHRIPFGQFSHTKDSLCNHQVSRP
jgi:hypothetical protein